VLQAEEAEAAAAAAAAELASRAEHERQTGLTDDEEDGEEDAGGDVDAVPADLAGIHPVAEADEQEAEED